MFLFSNTLISIIVAITMALLINTAIAKTVNTEATNHISQTNKLLGAMQPTQTKPQPRLQVYKSPTCQCCEKWLKHIEQHGFISTAHNQTSLSTFKSDKGIAPQYRSCHTAVSKAGYIFEGHVPAKFIHQFLANPPENAIGLAVPGMPIGSPGMEVGDKFMPYQVLLLNADNSYVVYAELNSYQEQF
jgi:hypothetical protein